MGQDEKTKRSVGVKMLPEVEAQLRQLIGELVDRRFAKANPIKEVQGVPVADEQLLQVAGKFAGDVKQQQGLMLGAIEILLAGADMLACDTISALQIQRGSLQGGMQSQSLEENEDADEDADEDAEVENSEAKDGREYSLEDCESTIKGIEQALCPWVPLKQAAVLKHVLSLMPERQREYEAETAANEACEEFINYIAHNKSDDEQKAFYEEALAAVKAGNGVVALKVSA